MEKMTMTVVEMSKSLGISLPYAYQIVRTEGFPVIKAGKKYLVLTDALKDWLTENKGITIQL